MAFRANIRTSATCLLVSRKRKFLKYSIFGQLYLRIERTSKKGLMFQQATGSGCDGHLTGDIPLNSWLKIRYSKFRQAFGFILHSVCSSRASDFVVMPREICFRILPALPGALVPSSISCTLGPKSETFMNPCACLQLAQSLCRINCMLVVYPESATPHDVTNCTFVDGGAGELSVLQGGCLFS